MNERLPRATPATGAPDQFQRARAVFESALDWPPAERTARVRQACGDDPGLVHLVEEMLRADAAPHVLLDGAPGAPATRWPPGHVFAGRYRVGMLVGRGGMGEVYRARDVTLGRDVALKVLPPDATPRPDEASDRVARFAREAQVLASLNHPNIAAIHGVEADAGVRALVLELVEGPTLADRIAAGALPLGEAVAVARQIAVGLEAAHEQGIVHRDLKPANVKLRPDGTVKLLDFGLAKVVQPEASALSGTATSSPTVTSASMIQRGVLLGTAAYMSPEQAKGREADRRSDVWAFGAVLYEMLTGRRAFAGDDIPDTLASVLRAAVDWTRLPGDLPPPLRRLIERCLEPNTARRLRDIGEARIVLDDLASGATAGPGPVEASRSPWPIALPWLAAALVVGAGLGAWLWPRPVAPSPTPIRFALTMPAESAIRPDPQSRDLAVTPDGSRVIYKGGDRLDRTVLFVRRLDGLEPVPLIEPGQPKGPFASPDGQWLGFFEPGPPGAALKKVALAGGPPIEVSRLDGPSRGATWGADGTIVTASGTPATGLLRIPAAGGPFEVLTRPNRAAGEADHLYPQFLPGDTAVLFTITAITGGIDSAKVAVFDLASARWTTLLQGASQAQYVSTGHLVYMSNGALWATPFDLARRAVLGTPAVVVPRVLTLPTGVAEFDIAADGTLAYVPAGETGRAERTLAWVDRQGREEPIAAPPRAYGSARLSPDGTRIAVEIEDATNDIWVWDLRRETMTRVTTDPGLDETPVWTPDGRRLIYTSEAGGMMGTIYWRAADGSGEAEQLGDASRIQRASTVMADGVRVIVSDGSGLGTIALDGSRRTETLLRLPRGSGDGAVSPDRRWIAYVAVDAGRPNVFVSPLATPDRDRIQVTPAGGMQPRWTANGRELLYLGVDGAVMSVNVPSGPSPVLGKPVRVLETPYFYGLTLSRTGSWDVGRDGRFLVIKEGSTPARAPALVVVKHWFEELKRLVPRP